MRIRLTARVATLVAASLSLVLLPAQPGQADIHIGAFGVGTGGQATVSPAWSDEPQKHISTLSFDAVGTGYFATNGVPGVIEWDCTRRDSESELPADQRHGFTLTSLEHLQEPVFGTSSDFDDMETRTAGAGMAAGRCTGSASLLPHDPMELACPYVLFTYARVGVSLHLAGMCTVSWGGGFWAGDLTLHTTLIPTSDGASYDLAGVVFRMRG